MKLYKTVVRTTEIKVLDSVSCNICKSPIIKGQKHFTVTTSHSDWGNDSHESAQYKDICSDACASVEFNRYLHSDQITKKIKFEQTDECD
jgi:hypothetical protein